MSLNHSIGISLNTANVVTYDVVISVDNPEQLLLPGMTAYVNINFAKHDNVLLVPNAALRYRPKNEELNLAMEKDKKPDDNASKTKTDDLGSGKIYVLRKNSPEDELASD